MSAPAARVWKHDELLADLAQHLERPDRMLWTDLQLGPVGSMRPDVYAIDRSFANPSPTAYEVKVSRADFLADVTAGKWIAYLSQAEAVYFAVPLGMVKRSEVPQNAGLYVRSETGWAALRRPTRQVVQLEPQTLLKLLIDGAEHVAKRKLAKLRRDASDLRWSEEARRKQWGERVAAVLANTEAAERRLEALEHHEARQREEAKKHADACLAEVRTFCADLGVEFEERQPTVWAVRRKLEALRRDKTAVDRARAHVTGAQNAIARALAELAELEAPAEIEQ